MKKYIIRVNDQYILEEDLDNFYDFNINNNIGFHSYDRDKINKIIFTKNKNEAKIIEGAKNLNSWINKILVREKFLDFNKIIIENI